MLSSPNNSFPFDAGDGGNNWVDTTRYTVIQRFFLNRMERLVALRKTANTLEPWQNALVNRAIYSTYRDCAAQGLSEDAREVLHRELDAPHHLPST